MNPTKDPILDIRDLHLTFRGYGASIAVLHGIDLCIQAHERVALVGESGSGKSVTARIVLGLFHGSRTARVSGQLMFDGQDLSAMRASKRARLRGTDMSMIFQDPMASLNPVFTIGTQFTEVLQRGTPAIKRTDSHTRACSLLAEVSIADPERVLLSYPFQLSGGMNQRVMIAMAMANQPRLLIADEPGTALDVTVQAQTLGLMQALVVDHGTAMLFISHNLGVVREFADRTYVIYRGRIVEHGPTSAIFAKPGHPYTRALMAAIPRITGTGLPELPESSAAFDEPMVTHEAPA